MKLTNEQKNALARLLIRGAVDALNAFEEEPDAFPEAGLLADVDQEVLYGQAAKWLNRLPGTAWDARLPNPGEVSL